MCLRRWLEWSQLQQFVPSAHSHPCYVPVLPSLASIACQTDEACANFRLPGWDTFDRSGESENMTCYKGGNTVRENFQMCDVTSKLPSGCTWATVDHLTLIHHPDFFLDPAIIRELGTKKPQVTFSCSTNATSGSDGPEHKTCNFQFWIASVESFFCTLDECDWKFTAGAESNVTEYKCGKIRCDCVPGRMLCGEDGSVK